MESIQSELVPSLLETLTSRIRTAGVVDASQLKGSQDEEIEILQLAFNAIQTYTTKTLAQLRSRRNQLAPVYRLPADVLSLVFRFADRRSKALESSPGANLPVCVASVCQAWRAVALDTPRLWTSIATGSVPLTDLFIKRSGNAPLNIFIDTDKTPLSKRAPFLFEHINRWASLKLTGSQLLDQSALQCLRRPAPALEVLEVCHNNNLWLHGACTTVDKLFGGEAPKLREISLTSFHLPLTLSVFSGLTKLELTRIRYTRDSVFSQLLCAIEASPALRSLRLAEIFFDFEPDLDKLSLSAPGAIDSSRLRYLSLRLLDPWVIKFILSRIVLSSRSLLDLVLHDMQPDESLGDLFPSNPTNLHNLGATGHVLFHASPFGDMCLLRGFSQYRGTTLAITVTGGPGNGPVQRILSSLGPTLSTMPLEMVTIDRYVNRKWSTAALIRTLNSFPTLGILHLRNCHPKFVQALTVTLSSHPCPNMNTLIVSGCPIPDGALISTVLSRTAYNKGLQRNVTPLMGLVLCGPLNASMVVRAVLSTHLEVSWHKDDLSAPDELEGE
ncbi:hypothetical protein BOTBODRAFT_33450 [Botryobasidium botryosum FD-172 SS1]|uniref:F-box domain-containing protein n=1 Tax=Botryobasidium botryosum (strain FD-172 SS1) TaxID=930990 RepID=A0A067MCF4_BOTB1|nr:hypothetical protein BOTBODRAFT_33450 [Botryobasidium botryosum FD-172 SS1]